MSEVCAGAGAGADKLGLRPLTARSVILSVLLGSHPPLLPVRWLVGTAELFGIAEGTTRVALSRLVADGDVVADESRYRLSDRLLVRQHRQDEGQKPATRPWRGSWELALADPGIRGAAERAQVGAELAALRLAEMRSGVWIRPANLRREWPEWLHGRAWRFEGRAIMPSDDRDRGEEGSLAASLWDLPGWADRARALLGALATAEDPASRFVVAAAMVRHLQLDPLLPPSLLPARWPGGRLRRAYASYQPEVGRLLREARARQRAR